MSAYHFADFELDPARFELRRNGRSLKLERIPMELLILLVEKDGNIATRQEIVDRLWEKTSLSIPSTGSTPRFARFARR